ncbi:MAG: response regulator transcription factor [Alphaproteobacteria bacterium]|nr:response regulator transcription factor [Alphaproteobacteria bacterium]
MTSASQTAAPGDARLLIVDDDSEIRAELGAYLGANGFGVATAANGAEAERHLSDRAFDVILLDLWLGNENGFDVLRRLRQTRNTPCIMVTAQDEVTDTIVGLELGADDYLVKPVNLRELLARIRALIRRSGATEESGPSSAPPPKADDEANWKFDPMRRSLRAATHRTDADQTRDELCRRVFNREWSPYDRGLDGIIVKLRRKLEPNPDNPLVIKTVRGRGYVFTGFVR